MGKISRALALVLLIGVLAGILLYQLRLPIQRWMRERAIKTYVARIAPHLPFVVEAIDIDSDFKSLVQGKIAVLNLVIRKENFRFSLEGPFELGGAHETGWVGFRYRPQTVIEKIPGGKSEKLPLEIAGTVSKTLDGISYFSLKSGEVSQWKFPAYSLALRSPSIKVEWDSKLLQSEGRVAQLDWKNGAAEWGTREIRWDVSLPLTLQPFRLGPEVRARVWSDAWEFLEGEVYRKFLVADLPVEIVAMISEGSNELQSLNVEVRKPVKPSPVQWDRFPRALRGKLHWTRGKSRVEWNFSALDLKWLALQLNEIVPGALDFVQIKKGSVSIRGNARVINQRIDWQSIRGAMKVAEGNFYLPGPQIFFQNVQFTFLTQLRGTSEMPFAIEKIYFRKLPMQIEPMKWKVKATHDQLTFDADSIPLKIESAETRLGAAHVEVTLPPQEFHYDLTASLEAKWSQGKQRLGLLCLESKLIPDFSFEVDLPKIRARPGVLTTEGSAQVNTLGGFIRLRELKGFHLLSGLPEIQFHANWANIRLDEIGKLSGFGEMDGMLSGYVYDMVSQGWLPTRYDFRLEVIPLQHRDIVFSPQAMKNLVQLLSGENLDEQLPGIANTLAFGWPSRLFGGYDIDYAGINLMSNQGSILLETLDPPEIFERERKHFFLFGPRFKIPIRSKHYPVVLDAYAVGNFLQRMIRQFKQLKEKENGTDADDEYGKPCIPPPVELAPP